MKPLQCILALSVICSVSVANGQQRPTSTDWTVTERGPHYAVHEREEVVDLGGGQVERVEQRYIEMATGMHYMEDGQWKESREEFIVLSDGYAVAAQGQHKVIVSPILNDANGAVDMETPDGKRMRSTILGLALRDRVTDQQLLVAEIRDGVVGRKVSSNEILFEDCFDDLRADVRLTYKRGGFHQDVILRERFDPVWLEKNGFNPETTRLEIWTEFFEAPTPQVRQWVVSKVDDPVLRAALAEPDILNDDLDFGVMQMPMGRAYAKKAGGTSDKPTLMPKRWVTIDGRRFLVESISLFDLAPLLSALPGGGSFDGRDADEVKHAGLLPPSPRLVRPGTNSILTASLPHSAETPGVVLDYDTKNGALTDFTFESDTTYHLTGEVICYGTTVLEGGTVLKYTNGSSPTLLFYGPLDCQTGPYRPAILTAKDDDTVGAQISGSTGDPEVGGDYGSFGIQYRYNSGGLNLHDVRIAYKGYGIEITVPGLHYVRHCQLHHVGFGLAAILYSGGTVNVGNVLVDDADAVFLAHGSYPVINVEHLTAHDAGDLFSTHGSAGAVNLTNSLLVSTTLEVSGATFNGANNATNDNSSVFQTVGAGAHYLADDTYRNAGTTNISAELLADLKAKTTYAPVVTSNVFSADTVLTKQVPRDTAEPDIGYHYDAIDYIADTVKISNAKLTIAPGVVVAGYHNAALWPAEGAELVAAGTPAAPIWLVRYNTVQEQPVSIGEYGTSSGVVINPYCTNVLERADATLKFVRFSIPANTGYAYYNTQDKWTFHSLTVEDCDFYPSTLLLGGYYNSESHYKNDLFYRGSFLSPSAYTNNYLSASNCMLYGLSTVNVNDGASGWYSVFNNAFVDCILTGHKRCSNGYNAYINCNTNFLPADPNSIITSNPIAWRFGPLGDFYQPTNSVLINAGSTNASLVGLYHYTTMTSQEKEGDSVVDIGYHYVAVDGNGDPIDTDDDGIPDYFEDTNGNGLYEADVDLADFHSEDTDGDGLPDGWELNHGSDPNHPTASLLIYTPSN